MTAVHSFGMAPVVDTRLVVSEVHSRATPIAASLAGRGRGEGWLLVLLVLSAACADAGPGVENLADSGGAAAPERDAAPTPAVEHDASAGVDTPVADSKLPADESRLSDVLDVADAPPAVDAPVDVTPPLEADAAPDVFVYRSIDAVVFEDPRPPTGELATAPPFMSGTRIAVRVREIDGAPPQFVSLHDTKLGIDCEVALASDLRLRCLPVPLWIPQEATAFLDPECGRRLLVPPSFPLLPSGTLGTAQTRGQPCVLDAYRARRVDNLQQYWREYRSVDGGSVQTCRPTSSFSGTVLDRLPPTDFVAADELHVATGASDAAPLVWRTEDGATAVVGVMSRRYQSRCDEGFSKLAGELSTSRCIPNSRVSTDIVTSGFADERCQLPLQRSVAPPDACGRRPAFAKKLSAAELFTIGEPLSGAVFTRFQGEPVSGCSNRGAAWFVGEPVSSSEFAAVEPRAVGSGRLRVVEFTDVSGKRLAVSVAQKHYLDSATNLHCELEPGATGQRCVLPFDERPLSSFPFADANCTQRLYDDPFGATLSNRPGGVADVAVRPEARFTGDTYYRLENSRCAAAPVALGPWYRAQFVPWTEPPLIHDRLLPLRPN